MGKGTALTSIRPQSCSSAGQNCGPSSGSLQRDRSRNKHVPDRRACDVRRSADRDAGAAAANKCGTGIGDDDLTVYGDGDQGTEARDLW